MFADQGDISFLLFFRQKQSSQDWVHSKQLKIVGRNIRAVQLNGISQTGENEAGSGVRCHFGKNCLVIPIMPKPWNRGRQLPKASFFRLTVNVHDAQWLVKRQTAQEEI